MLIGILVAQFALHPGTPNSVMSQWRHQRHFSRRCQAESTLTILYFKKLRIQNFQNVVDLLTIWNDDVKTVDPKGTDSHL